MATLRTERAAFKGAVRCLMDQTGVRRSTSSFNRQPYHEKADTPPTQQLVSSTARPPPTNLARLPYDVLLPILRASRAPFYQLDPSVAQGPKSPWLAEQRYRKGLLLVCRGWTDAATDLFYEDIVLRRVGQIFALAAALESQKHLARVVKTIRLESCLVPPACANAARDALRSIFSLCTGLGRFEYHSAEHFPTATALPAAGDIYGPFNRAFVDDSLDPFQLAYRQRVSTLTVLDLAMPLSYKQAAQLHGLLSGAGRLGTLKLRSVRREEGEEDQFKAASVLTLPHLMELYISVSDAHFVAYVSTSWVMPALERLTTLDTRAIPTALLTAHGLRLRYLHLCPAPRYPHHWQWKPANSAGVEHIPELCPLIEHLVLYPKPLSPANLVTVLGQKCPRYLDIYTITPRVILPDEQAAVSVRLLWATHPDLPAIFDPRVRMAPGATNIFHLRGVRLLCSENAIMSDVEPHCAEAFPPLAFKDYDKDRSGTYKPPKSAGSRSNRSFLPEGSGYTTPSSATSSGWSERSSEADDDEEEGEETDDNGDSEDDDGSEGLSEHDSDCWQPDEQLDRNVVLDLFRSTRDHAYDA